jgi:hypothetical protein
MLSFRRNEGSHQAGLRRVILEIERNIHETARKHHHFDILGHFYQEFLKYSGGDKKGLGIVLTPSHITSLFRVSPSFATATLPSTPAPAPQGFSSQRWKRCFRARPMKRKRRKSGSTPF